MVLEIIEVQGPNGFARIGRDLLHQPLYLEIQGGTVKYSINSLFLS